MCERTDMEGNAANDPRFDTMLKRLLFWRERNETDEQFAVRIGVDTQRFLQWKRRERRIEDERIDLLQSVAKRLDICPGWFFFGDVHKVRVFSDGARRTRIYRYNSFREFTDNPEDNQPRPFFEYLDRERAALTVH